MMKMSESSKEQMAKDFGFSESELFEIEQFINNNDNKSAKAILDELILDKHLNIKQKIVISYIIGNSTRDAALRQEYEKKFANINLPHIPLSAG